MLSLSQVTTGPSRDSIKGYILFCFYIAHVFCTSTLFSVDVQTEFLKRPNMNIGNFIYSSGKKNSSYQVPLILSILSSIPKQPLTLYKSNIHKISRTPLYKYRYIFFDCMLQHRKHSVDGIKTILRRGGNMSF